MPTGVDIDSNINSSYYGFTIGIISPGALLYYDYFLTFTEEVVHFWSPLQCNWGTVIFLLNRYIAVFGHIPVVAQLFIPDSIKTTCSTLQLYHNCVTIVVQVIAATVMILRVHALWNRSNLILTFMLVTLSIVIAFGIWCVLSGIYGISPPSPPSGIIGCRPVTSSDQAWRYGAAWGGVFLFDVMIFGLTVYKTLKIGRTRRRTMVDILLRDGCVYFAIIGTATLSNILSLLLGGLFTRGLLGTFANILASICSTRLMINIRDQKLQWPPQQATLSASNPSRFFVSTFVDIGPTSLEETFHLDDIEIGPTKMTKDYNRYR